MRGNPTAPVISLHKVEKAGDKAVQGAFAFCHFLVVTSGSSLNLFFFFPDYESRILPCMFKSMQNVKSLSVWVSAVGYPEFLLEIQML